MQETRSVILGAGEVGIALRNVLSDYAPTLIDPKFGSFGVDIQDVTHMHVCFPYSETFIKDVEEYQARFKPLYTIIHSTVPVGTSRLVNGLHSPIRGIHPHLAEGIKTFVKFIGGQNASEVADYFRRAGLRVCLFDAPETTEALKLFDTEYYRVAIEFAQRVKTYCDKNKLNFHEVYTLGNQTYNEGYTKLGHPEFVRPVLQPIMTPISGHCVMPNAELIKKSE